MVNGLAILNFEFFCLEPVLQQLVYLKKVDGGSFLKLVNPIWAKTSVCVQEMNTLSWQPAFGIYSVRKISHTSILTLSGAMEVQISILTLRSRLATLVFDDCALFPSFILKLVVASFRLQLLLLLLPFQRGFQLLLPREWSIELKSVP